MNNSTYVVEFNQSSREMREKRKRELCHFYVRGLIWVFCVLGFYVMSGWFIKWLWYYDRPTMFHYMIFDWEQLCAAAFSAWVSFGIVTFAKFYCPFCMKYSDYEARHIPEKRRIFCYYQLAATCYILIFAGIVELMNVVFIKNYNYNI